MNSRLVIAAVATLLASSSPAVAWVPPEVLSSPSNAVDSPNLAFTPGGQALAAWRSWATFGGRENVFATTRDQTGRFAPPRRVGTHLDLGGVAVDRLGRPLIVGVRGERVGDTVHAFTGPGFGKDQVLERSKNERVQPPVLASDLRGDAVVAWRRGYDPRFTAYIALVATRVDGGRFSGARVASGTYVHDVAAAMNESGQFVVAWLRGRRVEVRLGRGHRLGPVRRVGTLRPTMYAEDGVTAAIDSAGNVLVAWRANVGKGATGSVAGATVAYRPAGRAFAKPALVSSWPSDVLQERKVRAVFTEPGHAVLAWNGADQTGEGVLAASAERGVPSAPTMLSPPGGRLTHVDKPSSHLDAIAVLPHGGAAVAWTHLGPYEDPLQPAGELLVSLAFDGEQFASPETVNAPGDDALDATLGFDPRSSAPAALWQSGSRHIRTIDERILFTTRS
jgi:hypothetical protein